LGLIGFRKILKQHITLGLRMLEPQKKLIIMATLRNKVQLIGNLGNDPEIITLESGKKLAKFAIATNENYKNAQGEKVTDTQWHNIIAWNKTADVVEQYVTKGKEIAVEGKLTSRSYEDKEGQTRYITEVVVNELLLLGSKQTV
jgi:single-strand DNA-binding protein